MDFLLVVALVGASGPLFAAEPLEHEACASLLLRARTPGPDLVPLSVPISIDTTAVQLGNHAAQANLATPGGRVAPEVSGAANAAGNLVHLVNDSLFIVASQDLDRQINMAVRDQPLDFMDDDRVAQLVQNGLDGLEKAFSFLFFGPGSQVRNVQARFIDHSELGVPIITSLPLLKYLLRNNRKSDIAGAPFVIYYGQAPNSGERPAGLYCEFFAEWTGESRFVVKSMALHLGDLNRFFPQRRPPRLR